MNPSMSFFVKITKITIVFKWLSRVNKAKRDNPLAVFRMSQEYRDATIQLHYQI